ncbi:MAG: ABC transporter substrate-binding protein, partial [Anaerolineales bacterium]|nr:ABC transporter substrate-binding protein [Anaerolineales bacterium]
MMVTRAKANNIPRLENIPERVVSLVPSLTESFFDLGLGDYVVGITDYCIYPKEKLVNLPRVGGTKNARIEDILLLKPDLVIANRDENNRDTAEYLKAAGIPVWVTFPLTIADVLADLRDIAGLFQNSAAFIQIDILERAI